MAVSKEVQDAVDKVREMKDYIKADKAADKIRDQKIADLQSSLDSAQQKLDAIPVRQELSKEDKDALQHAFDEVSDASDALMQTHDELKAAVPANTGGKVQPEGANGAAPAEKPVDPQEEFRKMTPDQLAEARGQQATEQPQPNPPVDAPLMPNLAFNPAGTSVIPAVGDVGQPNQPAAIETAGGFVVAGGGSTQRAPGSRPESPSSSVVVPEDPNAKAPASTADEVKSGLGDSSRNAMLGPDGKPPQSGAEQQLGAVDPVAQQKQQDLLREEQARRAENPLNLSPEDQAKRDGVKTPEEQADSGKGTPADQSARDAGGNRNQPPASPAS